uniref:Uncharacterized protein n=1 Tax=Siphoviridae sp. ctoMP27 TaxID=2825667 RepID=A0A8S5UZC6_9CAUD|nr:MAG TPA: hypothetical protein [Siphoviridae sp. ctoMP27]
MPSITIFWTGGPCRCIWPPPLLPVCRKQAAACSSFPARPCRLRPCCRRRRWTHCTCCTGVCALARVQHRSSFWTVCRAGKAAALRMCRALTARKNLKRRCVPWKEVERGRSH